MDIVARAPVPIGAGSVERAKRRCIIRDHHRREVPYEDAWRWQVEKVEAKRAGIKRGEMCENEMIMLQHPRTITLGASSSLAYLRFDPSNPPMQVFRTERGGEPTYHGPGQLVIYPILDLRQFQPDLHWYARQLEQVALDTLATFGISGHREESFTGVFVGHNKVAAIGIRARSWVTFHGMAINVAPFLGDFDHIVPCGIRNKGVTSIEKECADAARSMAVASHDSLISAVAEVVVRSFATNFDVEVSPSPSAIASSL